MGVKYLPKWQAGFVLIIYLLMVFTLHVTPASKLVNPLQEEEAISRGGDKFFFLLCLLVGQINHVSSSYVYWYF